MRAARSSKYSVSRRSRACSRTTSASEMSRAAALSLPCRVRSEPDPCCIWSPADAPCAQAEAGRVWTSESAKRASAAAAPPRAFTAATRTIPDGRRDEAREMDPSPRRPSRLRGAPGCLVRVSIAPRDRADAASDVVVHVVGEIRERDSQRPVGRVEATAVEQDDAVLLGEAEREVERMDILLQVLDRLFANVLARPELEVDQAVVGVVVLARRRVEAEPLDHGLGAPVDDLHAGGLVRLRGIHQLVEGEQAHHDLLRQREPGGVVQRHVAAVGHDAVDELQLARLEGYRQVTLVERLQLSV